MLSAVSLKMFPYPRIDLGYSVYLLTFFGFLVYAEAAYEKRMKRYESRPHPLILDGKVIPDSSSCSPDDKPIDVLDDSLYTIADIVKFVFFLCVR